jgi:hypothetical protein
MVYKIAKYAIKLSLSFCGFIRFFLLVNLKTTIIKKKIEQKLHIFIPPYESFFCVMALCSKKCII